MTCKYTNHTNYPELKVIISEDAPAIDILQTQIDMDLELRLSEEYLMYRTEELLMSKSKYPRTEQSTTNGTQSVP